MSTDHKGAAAPKVPTITANVVFRLEDGREVKATVALDLRAAIHLVR